MDIVKKRKELIKVAKINKEEYELLKRLDDKWKWIARDSRGTVLLDDLWVYEYIPKRDSSFWTEEWGDLKEIPYHLFQFIQWEDREPHSIDNLIEEYELEKGMRYDFGKIKAVDLEVEEEQKYYVLFENQLHEDNWTYALTNSGSIEVFEKDVLPEWDITKLTEQEIKDFDPRYWPFRKPVEEIEENNKN